MQAGVREEESIQSFQSPFEHLDYGGKSLPPGGPIGVHGECYTLKVGEGTKEKSSAKEGRGGILANQDSSSRKMKG